MPDFSTHAPKAHNVTSLVFWIIETLDKQYRKFHKFPLIKLYGTSSQLDYKTTKVYILYKTIDRVNLALIVCISQEDKHNGSRQCIHSSGSS